MANNRLYIVDTSTGEYVCIAKGWGFAWNLGNVPLLDDFLESRNNEADHETNLVLIDEYHKDYERYIIPENNFNKLGGFEGYLKQPEKPV